MSPLIAWIPILAPIGSQNPPLDPSDPQPPSQPPLQAPLPAHLFRALHISMVTSTDKAMVVGKRDSKTSQSMPAKSGLSSEHFRKFLWGHPGEMGCRQKEEWRDQGMGSLTAPLTLSLHLRIPYSQCCCGEDPGRGARSPRMGTEGLHCARGKGKMFCGGVVLSKGKSSWYEAGEDGRGPWNQGVRA